MIVPTPPTAPVPAPPTALVPAPTHQHVDAHALPHTWVTVQPDGCWYQFREGPLKLVLQTTDPTILSNEWVGMSLRLLYAGTSTPVPSRIAAARTFKELSRSVSGSTISYVLRIDEITKNHLGKAFCFEITIGTLTIRTNGFQVMTKRTKRKRVAAAALQRSSHPSDLAYKRQTHEVLKRLQWRIGGYVSGCEGYADFTRPIYTCTMCNGHKTQGHIDGCPIIALLL
jgi:hypothetical protein